jgi:GT2 family glycosyltransferase
LTVAQQECPNAHLIRVSKAAGWSAARNLAATSLGHEILFCLDDDSTLAPDALARAADAMQSHERIAAVQPTIIERGRPLRASVDNRRVFTNLCVGQGAFSRRAFVAVGMFDPDFYYAEEMDLSLRLLESGYHIVFDPSIVVHHGIDQQTRRRDGGYVEVHCNMLRVVLKRAPLPLLLPWAGKKIVAGLCCVALSVNARGHDL